MKPGLIILVCIFAAGYITRPLFKGFILSATSNKAAACLELLGSTTTEESGRTYIVGSVRNSCDRKFGYVTISFRLDRPPGSTGDFGEATVSAYSRDLEPGQTKEFKSFAPVSRNATFRFDTISAY